MYAAKNCHTEQHVTDLVICGHCALSAPTLSAYMDVLREAGKLEEGAIYIVSNVNDHIDAARPCDSCDHTDAVFAGLEHAAS